MPAAPADATLLENLLSLYVHDLSEAFPLEPDRDGRFGYPRLPLYWQQPETHFAFLIHADARVVGFALATRGTPVTDDPNDLDVAEFFVLRRHRRAGIGKRAAFALWNRLPGRWIVRVSLGNLRGLPFWRAIVREYTGGAFSEWTVSGTPHDRAVLAFDAPGTLPA